MIPMRLHQFKAEVLVPDCKPYYSDCIKDKLGTYPGPVLPLHPGEAPFTILSYKHFCYYGRSHST